MVWFCLQKWLQFRYEINYCHKILSKSLFKVVVIPVGITAKTAEDDRLKLLKKASEVTATLIEAGVRSENDIRENVCFHKFINII
jgi:hypothetical protein